MTAPSTDPTVTLKEQRVLGVFLNGLPGTTLHGFRFSRGEYHLTVRIGTTLHTVTDRDFIGACAQVQTLHDTLNPADRQKDAA